ncbi:hypothetical protein SEA_BAJUNIPER_62 [Microbacterium phage BAjuniper]|nr:hypothetical protein SEA_BAJUNIPER_62 [Microbacterium phage BAjuniper]
MAKPRFTVYTGAGEPIAGDDRVDGLQAIAARHDGYITDKAGEVVYDSRPVEGAGLKPFAQAQLGEFDSKLAELENTTAAAAPAEPNLTEENEQ